VLIVHAKELKRTTNTGRLGLRALLNSEMHIRGEGREPLDLRSVINPEYRSLLLFPAEDARELTRALVQESDLPIQLIVPDGNWRQASKVHGRHAELNGIPRVRISAPNTAARHLRAESTPAGMSTLQAIAQALKVIEGEAVFAALDRLYQAKLEGTMRGRGQL